MATDAQRPPDDTRSLVDAARSGDRGALARLLSMVERGGDEAHQVGVLTHPLGGGTFTIGLTGAPGAGKSTLTAGVLTDLRAGGDRVAVLAVDPSSPFSGGAIMGDRVRMHDHDLDDGVYIRSMATRGHLGGLALATPAAVRVLDAAGFPWVVIETVGVGQVEVDVAGAADTTVVVLNPGWGDAVQAAKAGLLEIADVFVLNKADRPGAAEAERDLSSMLAMTSGRDAGWSPPIIRTVATAGEGADRVVDAVRAHRRHLEGSGELAPRRRRRAAEELRSIVVARTLARVGALEGDERFEALADLIAERRLDPWSATDELLDGH